MVFGGKPYKKYNAGIVPDQLSPHAIPILPPNRHKQG